MPQASSVDPSGRVQSRRDRAHPPALGRCGTGDEPPHTIAAQPRIGVQGQHEGSVCVKQRLVHPPGEAAILVQLDDPRRYPRGPRSSRSGHARVAAGAVDDDQLQIPGLRVDGREAVGKVPGRVVGHDADGDASAHSPSRFGANLRR